MKIYKFKSIRTNLTFWFLLFALIPLLTATLFTYIQRKKAIEQESFNKLTAIRNLKVQQVEDWIGDRMSDLRVMSGDNDIRDLEGIMEKPSKSAEDIHKIEIARAHLNRLEMDDLNYEELFIINANTGLIELSSKPDFIGENESRNSYFINPLKSGKIYIKDIYFSKTLKRPQMTFSIPIFGKQNKTHIIGILVARINLDKSLYNLLLNRIGLGKTGETLIVNKEGFALNPLRNFENAVLKLQIEAEPALNASHGKTGMAVTKDYRGEDILAAYTYIPETKWGFVCKQDTKELNAPINEMLWNLILLFVVSGLIIILIVAWISKSISKPILNLKAVTQKMAGGDLSVRSTVVSEDEIGELALAYNKTAERLESKIEIQKGIAAISETMIGKSSLQEFARSLLKHLMKLSDANMSTFYILNDVSMEYEHFASVAANEKMLKPFNAKNPQGEFGNVLSTKKIFHLKSIPENTIFRFKTVAGEAIPKEIITIPVLIEGVTVAIISLVNINKFREDYIEILHQSWNNLNTSYSNLIANERTNVLAEHLSMINRQLEAQSEELQDQAEELQEQTEELQRNSEELRLQNVELEAQKIQVEAANKLKTEFLSNMSHELRTPLNSIMALSQVLIMQTKDKLDEEEYSYLEIVRRNGKNLLALINNILDLSKIEAGKMDVLPKYFSIGQLLEITKENLQSLAITKGITITLSLPSDLPKIESDEQKLHQVFTNIIGNAVKFTDKGSVDIKARFDEKNVFIEVKDSGIGISKEILPHIFEEFRQADGSTSRRYEGTGLGLAIAGKLTTILGGKIKVDSFKEEGSVFTLSFPIKWDESALPTETNIGFKKSFSPENSDAILVDDDPIADKNLFIPKINRDNQALKKNEKTKISRNEKFTPRILLVEDNPDAIIQLKAVLEKAHYKIDVATGGQAALDYVKHIIPDGIILDLMMSGIDGFEVLENIRNTAETKKIPVLILTAKDLTKQDLAKLNANHIQQLIHKGDVDIEGLLQKIKIMLKGEPEKPSTQIPLALGKKPNLLIVEDNPDNMITIKALLKGKYIIAVAEDGEQGIALAQRLLPDIILLGLSLSGLSGDKIIEQFKSNKKTKAIPLIAVTAQAMIGDREHFLAVGCDGYVSKPIDQDELLKEIRKLRHR